MTRSRDREAEAQTVRLEVPARPGYVVLARLALSAVCRLTALRDDDVADLKLAITEAASIFVGEAEDAAAPLQPVPHADEEEMLRFAFELRDHELVVEVECDNDVDIEEEERELSRAIIDATVDDCHAEPGSIVLVKRLGAADG